ncbi:OLC1v1014585C1 [Oldenlandia corymbosa var. corymbosa]|uniref:OLC1v1014585C1 n=1 Tax=Oldenlandia corymbosa var. corymbosa TaxID=529605 RepID=A0AAV1E116_OLDCO|nr:OLC1v1014585C1 [Oldenlandia corymbosa var. corymbosa]
MCYLTNEEVPHHQVSTWQLVIGSKFSLPRNSTRPGLKKTEMHNQNLAIRTTYNNKPSSSSSLSSQESHTLSVGAGNRSSVFRNKASTVAPSGGQSQQHQQNLTRRKSAPGSSSDPTRNQASAAPTRIVYRESARSDLHLPFWQKTWFIGLLLLMAVSFFGLAIFLYLTLDPDFASTPVSAASEGVQITYGSTIKLMHERTKFRLHSHDVPYGSGSGQQSVTGFPNVDDANSYWIVRPVPDSNAKQGDPIKGGSIIRLQHMKTRKWLHSHLHASPISGNMEVSCFGGDGESDTGDYWRLEIEGSGKTWRQDQRMRLHHVDTGGYLHSHDKKYQRIAGGQQEVCGVREKKPDNVWLAAEGVYLPVSDGKHASS